GRGSAAGSRARSCAAAWRLSRPAWHGRQRNRTILCDHRLDHQLVILVEAGQDLDWGEALGQVDLLLVLRRFVLRPPGGGRGGRRPPRPGGGGRGRRGGPFPGWDWRGRRRGRGRRPTPRRAGRPPPQRPASV